MSSDYDASGIQVIPTATNLYMLIRQMKVRPGLYLGSPSISALHHFIDGYNYACYTKWVDKHDTPPWSDFHEFVRARTGFSESTGGWCHMILSVNDYDEAQALAMFFEMFVVFTTAENQVGQ